MCNLLLSKSFLIHRSLIFPVTEVFTEILLKLNSSLWHAIEAARANALFDLIMETDYERDYAIIFGRICGKAKGDTLSRRPERGSN